MTGHHASPRVFLPTNDERLMLRVAMDFEAPPMSRIPPRSSRRQSADEQVGACEDDSKGAGYSGPGLLNARRKLVMPR